MQSLSIDILNKLCTTTKLAEMKDGVNTLFETGREVFCIINEVLTSSLSGWTLSNYGWLSAKLSISPKRGTSVFVNNLKFSNYLMHVKNWKFELGFGGEALERLGNILIWNGPNCHKQIEKDDCRDAHGKAILRRTL